MLLVWLVIFPSVGGEQLNKITCTDVNEKGSGSVFSVEELRSLGDLDEQRIKECIILLGKEELSPDQAKTIWAAILKVYGLAEEIPEETLQHLGWITNGIEPDHFYNLTLTEIDTIASFGKHTSLSREQLSALHGAIFEQWSSKEVEDLSSYDLAALRQILCAFNGSDILKIHPDAYKDAAPELASLSNCAEEVLEGLATLATNPLAFGEPKSWTSLQVAIIGCVVAGLPSVKAISAEAMEGFTKDTIVCLPPEVFKDLSDDYLHNLSPAAASALTPKQLSVLSPSQKYARELAVKGYPLNDNSAADRKEPQIFETHLAKVGICLFTSMLLK